MSFNISVIFGKGLQFCGKIHISYSLFAVSQLISFGMLRVKVIVKCILDCLIIIKLQSTTTHSSSNLNIVHEEFFKVSNQPPSILHLLCITYSVCSRTYDVCSRTYSTDFLASPIFG